MGAIAFAESALARHDRHQVKVRSQLDVLQADGVLPEPELPVPALDAALLYGLVDRHRYHEAWALVESTSVSETARGAQLGDLLRRVIAPLPEGVDPSFSAVLHLIRAGQATSALRALEQVAARMQSVPAWLDERRAALAELNRGHWRKQPAPVAQMTREHVLARLRQRDLAGALEVARAANERELAAVLARLAGATESGNGEREVSFDDRTTAPMDGHPLCEFQVSMGVLDKADRGYRRLLRADPEDDRARAMLADLIHLRCALGETVEPLPSRPASVAWLSKRAPRQPTAGKWSAGRWASGQRGDVHQQRDGARYRPFHLQESDEDSTGVLEAAHEAELLLKLGKADQALAVYRILAIRNPERVAYGKRIAEIEALIAQRAVRVAAEVTRRHSRAELERKRLSPIPDTPPRSPNRYERFERDQDDFETLVQRAPLVEAQALDRGEGGDES